MFEVSLTEGAECSSVLNDSSLVLVDFIEIPPTSTNYTFTELDINVSFEETLQKFAFVYFSYFMFRCLCFIVQTNGLTLRTAFHTS